MTATQIKRMSIHALNTLIMHCDIAEEAAEKQGKQLARAIGEQRVLAYEERGERTRRGDQ